MGASERLQLRIEASTSGEADMARLEARINSVIERAERGGKQFKEMASDAVAAAGAINTAFTVGRWGVDTYDRITTLNKALQATGTFAASTAGRFAVMGTAAATGIGLAAKWVLDLSYSTAKANTELSQFAAKLESNLQSLEVLTRIGKARGEDLTSFGRFPINDLRAYILELEKIGEPYAQAQRAAALFGGDASKALALVGTGFARDIDKVQSFTRELDGNARSAIHHFYTEMKAIGDGANPFPGLSKDLEIFLSKLKQGVTLNVALAMRAVENNVPRTPGGDFAGGELGPGIGATADPRLFLPTFEDHRRTFGEIVKAPGAPGLPAIDQRLARMARQFLEARRGTLEGMRDELGAAQRSVAALSGAAEGNDLAVVPLLQAQNRVRQLEAAIKAAEEAKQKADELARLNEQLEGRMFDISLRGKTPVQQEQARAVARFGTGVESLFAPLLIQEFEDRNAAGIASARSQLFDFKIPGFNAPNEESEKRARLFSSNLSRSISDESEKLSNMRQALGDITRIQDDRLDRQARIIELMAGPGGEIAALQQILALRIEAAERGNDIAAAERARFDYTVKILEKQKEAQREAKEIDGRIFDALIGRGAGLRGFASSFLLSTGRTVFQNFNEQFRTSIGSRLAIPGQGTAEEPNFLGRLLKGTPFGATPIDANTAATVKNTDIMERLNAALGGTPSFGGGTGSLLDAAGGYFGLKQKLDARIGKSGGTPVPIVNELGDIEGYVAAAPAGSSKLGKGIGIAGAAAAGFFGTKAGIDQGGVRGGLTAAGSLSGAAGAILGLAGVSGPAAPILAGVGLGLGLISSFMPDPKKLREESISRMLESSVYQSPKALGLNVTRMGDSFDYNRYGEMRPIVHVHVNALDAKSIMDRRGDLAEAIRGAIQDGHSVNAEIQGLNKVA